MGGVHVNQYNNLHGNNNRLVEEGLTDKIVLNGSDYISKLKLFSKNSFEWLPFCIALLVGVYR